jgi:hypothetical protein
MMIPRILYRTIGVAVLAMVVPGLLAAASVSSSCTCQTGPPTPESYKWNFSREASSLLQKIQDRAAKARNLAAKLQSFDGEPGENGWHMDGRVLNRLKAQVNPMDAMLCRLRRIQRATLPWQQKAIQRIAPAVTELTNTTQYALNYLNAHRQRLWAPTYTGDANDMYSEANRIVTNVRNFQEYAMATNQLRELRPKLGMSAKPPST